MPVLTYIWSTLFMHGLSCTGSHFLCICWLHMVRVFRAFTKYTWSMFFVHWPTAHGPRFSCMLLLNIWYTFHAYVNYTRSIFCACPNYMRSMIFMHVPTACGHMLHPTYFTHIDSQIIIIPALALIDICDMFNTCYKVLWLWPASSFSAWL